MGRDEHRDVAQSEGLGKSMGGLGSIMGTWLGKGGDEYENECTCLLSFKLIESHAFLPDPFL